MLARIVRMSALSVPAPDLPARRVTVLLLAAACVLAACGQKGPLTMPAAAAPAASAPTR
jgi:hypothetical protein